jgi:hydroxyacylglutathione hydrolase
MIRMNIERQIVGSFATNCYIVTCEKTMEAIIIDPGFGKGEAKAFLDELKDRGLKINYIVNTHGHADHTSGNEILKEATGAEILVHEADASMLANSTTNHSRNFGSSRASPAANRFLKEGDVVEAGNIRLTVLHTPGHTKGGISLYSQSDNVVFTGDTLFASAIGRTDMPGGSFPDIMRSLKDKIARLPDQTVVYPGHGEVTTIGKEKRTNPFLLG